MADGHHSEHAVSLLKRLVRPATRILFRPSVVGLENLPSSGPYLLVANHSAGLGIAEIASFAGLWAEHFESSRPLAAFAHPIGFKIWPLKALHRTLGSIPSTYDAAYDALRSGVPILVFPGGDHETFRPIWQANRVDFGGRRGYLRIAATARVPIVPMGIRGSHYTAPVLYRSRSLAWLLIVPRLFGIKRWALTAVTLMGWALIAMLPIDAGWRLLLAYLWTSSPFVFVPWLPWTIRFAVGAHLSPDELFGDEPDFAEAGVVVESRIQALVTGA